MIRSEVCAPVQSIQFLVAVNQFLNGNRKEKTPIQSVIEIRV